MTEMDLVDRLANHRTIGGAPRSELEWLAAHGHLRHLEIGESLSEKGAPVQGMFVMLSGRAAIFVDRGGGLHKLSEWGGGEVTGLLPYSRLVTAPGRSEVQEPGDVFVVPREHMAALSRECPVLTATLVHRMLDRAREFTSNELHDEKMVSLGRLSAGLAHELNNPAAAIERSASLLLNRLDDVEQAGRALGAAHLNDSQLDAIESVRNACAVAIDRGVRSPIERAEREEAIADWLNDHGLDVKLADALAETSVTFDALDRIAGAVDKPALNAVLRWAAAGFSVHSLAGEILEAALRISGLVVAVKGFTHMDQATVAEPVDLAQGLGNTVAVLKSKARRKSAAVVIDVENEMPQVNGFVGELNQVWANLIDNALDAIPSGGRVDVLAARVDQHAIVKIVDNGPGIAADIRQRIFDPFFTTKPVGSGTGLGLDIVRRLVQHNQGNIEVDSVPGRTEFRVTLPLAVTGDTRGTS